MTDATLPDRPVLYLVHCQDAQGRALAGVEIRVSSANGDWSSLSNACGDIVDPGSGLAGVTLAAGQYAATFWQNGQQIKHDGSLDPAVWNLAWPPAKPILVGLEPTSIAPVQRAPLGPFPSPVNYPTVLPFHPPAGRDLKFYRGNFCGLHIAGAPAVPGGNGDHPDLMMACLLDNYPAEWQDRYLLQYAEDGFTHLQRSVGHSLYYGHSVADHIALSKRAQSYGLWCDEWWLGGGEGDDWTFKARDKDAAYWAPILQPYIDQLLAAGVVDHACVGWQLDQWNAPGNPLISIIAYIGEALPQTVPLFTHWVNEALAWWLTGGQVWADRWQSINVHDRFTWWQAMQPYLSGGHHQGDNRMALTDPKLYQDKLLDTLDPFGGDNGKGSMGRSLRGYTDGRGQPFSLVGFEVTAQFQFDGQTNEVQGDGAGYLMTCTTSRTGLPMGGYGNGARMPDGARL